jgi:hypothetical protein
MYAYVHRACVRVSVRGETETALNKRLRWLEIITLLIIGPIMAACTTNHSFLQSDTLPQFRRTASLSYNEVVHFITLRYSILLHRSVLFIIFVPANKYRSLMLYFAQELIK